MKKSSKKILRFIIGTLIAIIGAIWSVSTYKFIANRVGDDRTFITLTTILALLGLIWYFLIKKGVKSNPVLRKIKKRFKD